jgi:group I intron endonuclease
VRSGIYQIRCLADGKVYIGSAVNIASRWRIQRFSLGRGAHHSSYLQRAWRKHGEDQFAFEVLQSGPKEKELVPAEQAWLDRVRPFESSNGYNRCPRAGSPLEVKHTPETRAKISERQKGRKAGAETRARISIVRKGRKQSPE